MLLGTWLIPVNHEPTTTHPKFVARDNSIHWVSGMNSPVSSDHQALLDCEECLHYSFRDKSLLRCALTHASGADARIQSNERLEFLGDAILGAYICELLYRRYPAYLEGDLTKIKSIVVSRQTCSKLSAQLGLGQFLFVGKGVAGKLPQSLLADVFEAIVAAIFLDGGHEAIREFLHDLVVPEVELAETGGTGENYKSTLQQMAQREFSETPIYKLMEERGPDHDKLFLVCVKLGGKHYEGAWGKNKKDAEQRAACNALQQIDGDGPKYSETDMDVRRM